MLRKNGGSMDEQPITSVSSPLLVTTDLGLTWPLSLDFIARMGVAEPQRLREVAK
jgi:hypothetical protein